MNEKKLLKLDLQHFAEKNYKSFTGLKEFYYGELNDDDTGIKDATPERIEFLQNISIETTQEMSRAYGDNTVAEMAVSTGATTLTTTFHKLPIEDRVRLYGYEELNGLYGLSANPNPPYVACVFAKTSEDGGTEWIGFTKGIFTVAGEEAATKGETVEFTGQETTGEFMPREVDGASEEMTYLIAYDAPGETTQRDALFQAVFGTPYPGETENDGGGVEG